MSRPLGSTTTPASSGFPATTGRSASERRIGTQCLRFLPRHAPFATLGPATPDAASTLAFSRSVQEPQTRLTPPLRRAPPGQQTGIRQACLEGEIRTSDFDAVFSLFRRLNSARPSRVSRSERFLERLPGPHLTRSSAPFPVSLTTTVFSQRGIRWFSACPRGPTLEGRQTSISCTAPLSRGIST